MKLKLRNANTAEPFSQNARLRRAFRSEENSGFRFAIVVRSLALLMIGTWLAISVPWPRVSYFLAFVVLFLITGIAAEFTRRRSRHPRTWTAAFILIDACLLTYVLIAPNPFVDNGWPLQVTLRFYNHLYLFLMLFMSALSYSPFLVIWTGISISAAWSAGVLYVRSLPDSFSVFPTDAPPEETLRYFLDPFFVNATAWSNQVALLLIASLIIAAAVWRARRLVRQQVTAEEARSNLSRYFSPNMVEQLSNAPRALDSAQSQKVAILFVDVVGFTKMSEQLPPDELIAHVRDFHGWMVERVFQHHGTVDKYMGDCVMATFGTPLPGTAHASNALRCAVDILDTVDDWNAVRSKAGLGPIKVGVGLHYGDVVVGNVGTESRLEYTVMGDPVNVTSRLERMTREHDTPIIVSNELLEQVRREMESAVELLTRFADLGVVDIRGRGGSVHAWRYAGPPALTAGQIRTAHTPH
ncbi:MAG: adenylate/guanylate cyclase domain-containing protein [Alphaproteobacteria bacterium]